MEGPSLSQSALARLNAKLSSLREINRTEQNHGTVTRSGFIPRAATRCRAVDTDPSSQTEVASRCHEDSGCAGCHPGIGFARWSCLVLELVAGTPHPLEVFDGLGPRRIGEDLAEEPDQRVMMSDPVGGAVSVCGEQGFTYRVTGIVGEAVDVLGDTNTVDVSQRMLCLLQEGRGSCQIDGNRCESSAGDQCFDRFLLSWDEWGQTHEGSPMIGTIGLEAISSRNPDSSSNSSWVRIVGFTGRPTWASTRSHTA